MGAGTNCIFCNIIKKEIPSRIIYEDELAVAFDDVNPQAAVHILVVPRKHLPDIASMTDADRELVGHLFWVGAKIAAEQGIAGSGFRTVINNGPEAGQTVFHIHMHLLAGRSFAWPPG